MRWRMFGIIMVTSLLFLTGCASSSGLAKCLTEKGVKMYGAHWCPNCHTQKEVLGSSFKHIDYVECALPNGLTARTCMLEGIKYYPTWRFPSGESKVGILSLTELAELSGCTD